jgi:hypothetical protein
VTPAELIEYKPTAPLIWQKRMGLVGEEQERHEIEEEEQESDRKPQ